MGSVIPVTVRMAPEWVDALVMTGVFLLVAVGGLIWLFFFHKTRRRRRKHRHHHDSRLPDGKLSPHGGLPPAGRKNPPPAAANEPTVMQQSRAITRKSASNLALAFVILPRTKRDAMSALYALCREVDDVADEEFVPADKRREQLSAWREDIRRACDHEVPQFAVNLELQPVIRRYHLPFALFDELLKGCEMDLDVQRYDTFEQLELYCHRVASAVGLLSIEIFGYQNPACRNYAIYLGKALQLTNILRDVRTDAERGRIYLPLAELKKYNVSEAEILTAKYSDRYFALATSVADRARDFYRLARETLPAEDRRAMVAAELMGSVYWRLLLKLKEQQFNVFGPQPARLSKGYKTFLILQSWLRFVVGATASNYGPH